MKNRMRYSSKDKQKEEYLFVKTSSYLPAGDVKKLEEFSKIKSMPISQLIGIAVHHEFQRRDAFRLETHFNGTPRENQFADEAGKLFRYLQKSHMGLSLIQLLIAQRDIGINSDEGLIGAYMTLKIDGMIEEVYPARSNFSYDRTHRVARVIKEKS